MESLPRRISIIRTVAGNKAKLLENLVALTKDKVFDEIYDVRDEALIKPSTISRRSFAFARR